MLRYCEVSAPAKVILFGEHAVVYGRAALACSLGKYLKCALTVDKCLHGITIRIGTKEAISHTFERKLFQDFEGFNDDVNSPTHMDDEKFNTLQSFIQSKTRKKSRGKLFDICIFFYLCIASSKLKDSNAGIIIEITSEIPFGSGLGSSASLSVALASAFLLLCQVIDPQSQAVGEGHLHGNFCDKDLDIINAWAFEGEKFAHGLPSGIDNTVITFGGMIYYKKGMIRRIDRCPEMEIILVYTRVSRNTNSIVMDLRNRHDKLPRIYDSIFDSIEAITEECTAFFEEVQLNTGKKEENREIYEKILEMIALNHGLLRVLDVSHDSIEKALDIMKSCGFKGKLTGAGGGGCLFAIIEPGTEEFAVISTTEYIQKSGFDCWTVKIGGSGVKCIKYEA